MGVSKHLRRALVICLLVLRAAVSPAIGQAAASCPPPPPGPLTAQQVQDGMAQARDRGFLWRLTKGDHSSYLYGTIHVARREWVFPGPKVLRALRNADTVALELDPLDPKTQDNLSSALRRVPGPELPIELKERIEQRRAFECAAPEAFQKLGPGMQVLALTFFAARRDGLDVAYGIDGVLAGFARGSKKRVVALETTETQVRILTRGGTVESLGEAMDDIESGRTVEKLRRLAEMWADADAARFLLVAETMAESDSDSERALMAELLDARNPGMASGIDALHESGSKVFAAVGALHMLGPRGLPSLMSEKGYRVEPISLMP
jgi:uncharacterized protein